MGRVAEAPAWWAEVDEVRERIERRRAQERPSAGSRGVRELTHTVHLTPVGPTARRLELQGGPEWSPASARARARARRLIRRRVGPRPDRVAALAVWLGIALLVAALLSAHG
jgi:hypothetical protein